MVAESGEEKREKSSRQKDHHETTGNRIQRRGVWWGKGNTQGDLRGRYRVGACVGEDSRKVGTVQVNCNYRVRPLITKQIITSVNWFLKEWLWVLSIGCTLESPGGCWKEHMPGSLPSSRLPHRCWSRYHGCSLGIKVFKITPHDSTVYPW